MAKAGAAAGSREAVSATRFGDPDAVAGMLASNVTALSPAGLAGREPLYRDLLNALPAAIYTTDAAGRITFFNDAAVAFSGRRPTLGVDEWCVTWKLFELDGTPMPHDQCPMAIALKEGRAVRGAEAVAERPDGSRITFAPYPTPLRDDNGKIVGAVNMLVDITERKKAETRQSVLANEVNHRANNLLTLVQATLRMTQADTVEAFRSSMEGRIGALAQAHSLLADSRWEGADLQRLVMEELAPYLGAEPPRFWITGPMLPLKPSAAQAMAMIVHELATNATKHGALSAGGGRVLVDWRHGEDGKVVFRWTELGGPATRPPARNGVGTKVIQACAAQLRGAFHCDWTPAGLVCELTAPASQLVTG